MVGLFVEARIQERARKLGRASNRGPEAPIVVYNDPARSRGQTRSPRRRTGCSNTIRVNTGVGHLMVTAGKQRPPAPPYVLRALGIAQGILEEGYTNNDIAYEITLHA
ncbi:predicted protein [Postia placenta Mad-698-R]|nr:predicted protein [Postia placenta Mad-698-R]